MRICVVMVVAMLVLGAAEVKVKEAMKGGPTEMIGAVAATQKAK